MAAEAPEGASNIPAEPRCHSHEGAEQVSLRAAANGSRRPAPTARRGPALPRRQVAASRLPRPPPAPHGGGWACGGQREGAAPPVVAKKEKKVKKKKKEVKKRDFDKQAALEGGRQHRAAGAPRSCNFGALQTPLPLRGEPRGCPEPAARAGRPAALPPHCES